MKTWKPNYQILNLSTLREKISQYFLHSHLLDGYIFHWTNRFHTNPSSTIMLLECWERTGRMNAKRIWHPHDQYTCFAVTSTGTHVRPRFFCNTESKKRVNISSEFYNNHTVLCTGCLFLQDRACLRIEITRIGIHIWFENWYYCIFL